MDNHDNNTPLPMRFGVEWIAAILSALSVAPAISIIDKAIVSNASGKEKLVPCIMNGLKMMFKRPVHFLRQPAFLMIWGVYSGTYIAANSMQSICERSERSPVIPVFIGSSATNATLSILKDKAYTKMFGVGEPRKLPPISYALFATRDSLTILASFTWPKIIGKALEKRFSLGKQTSFNIAQLTAPCLVQFISSPLHLYALDRYNRPEKKITFSDRFLLIRQEYLKTSLARIARILPAFGIGGIVNKHLRKSGKEFLRVHRSTIN